MISRDAPLRKGDSAGRLPGDRPVRFDDVYETDEERKAREFREWSAKGKKRLTEDQVKFLRSIEANDMKRADQARALGVGIQSVRRAALGQTFTGPRAPQRSSRRVLTDDQVRQIRDLHKKGWTTTDIEDETGITSRGTIEDVAARRTYKDVK